MKTLVIDIETGRAPEDELLKLKAAIEIPESTR